MKWLKKRFTAFVNAAGQRRYLLGALTVTILGISDSFLGYFLNTNLQELTDIPSWCFSVLLAILITWYWLLEYIVELRAVRNGAFQKLGQLREAGVSLRNRIQEEVHSNKGVDVKAYIEDIAAWHKSVEEELRVIDEGAAIWYRTLDVMPAPRVILLTNNPKLAHHFRMHDRRLANLGTLIRDMLIAKKQHM